MVILKCNMFPILIIYNAGSSVRDDDYSLLLKVKMQRRYQPLPLLTASHGFILMWGVGIYYRHKMVTATMNYHVRQMYSIF